MPQFRRILIIKPSSLGDVVHALPTLVALRKKFPTSWISWLIKQEWADILAGNPDLNEVLSVDLRMRFWPGIIAKLRHARFDLVVDLQGLFRSALLARLSGAPERVGFASGREGSPFLYTQLVRLPSRMSGHWRLLDMHPVDRNLTVAKHLGAEIQPPRFRLPSFASDEKEVEGWLQEAGVQSTDRLIAMASVDRLGIRSWPLDRFVAVAGTLSQCPNVRIVLIGTPAERWVVEHFRHRVGDKLVNLVGKTRVRQLGVLLRRVHLLIANDSAPMHIASAVGTRVLGLFGPTSYFHHKPIGDGHVVLRSEIPCSPCGRSTCANPNVLECLTSIRVEDVVARANRMLATQRVD